MGPSPAVSPDGKVMVTVLENGVRYWNLRTFKPITPAIKYKSKVYGLKFSADGKWFFCRNRAGLTVRDPKTGKLLAGPFATVVHGNSSIYSATTQKLATFENKSRKDDVWSSEAVIRSGKAWSKERRIKLDGHVREAHWVDDSHLLIVGDHRVPGRRATYGRKLVYLVSLAMPAKVTTLVRDIWIPAVRVAPDRKHIIIHSREETICWKVGNEKPAWSKFEKAHSYFGNGNWFLLQEGTTSVVYSLSSGKELWRREGVERARVQGANIWLCRKNGNRSLGRHREKNSDADRCCSRFKTP